MFKIGSQFFTAAGPAAIKEIAALGVGIFLDLKFHDIPNTVAGSVLCAASMPAHPAAQRSRSRRQRHAESRGAGRQRRSSHGRRSSSPAGRHRPDQHGQQITCTKLASRGPPSTRVTKLATLAKKAGVDGVVASVQEARAIRKACGREFLIVTPGVRPGRQVLPSRDDQSRTATPTQAIAPVRILSSVGRPILAAAGSARSASRRHRGRDRRRKIISLHSSAKIPRREISACFP